MVQGWFQYNRLKLL